MSGSLEAIERLINEADSKFEDKLKHAQAGHTANLTVYADRTYNLRQQIAHNASLTNDDHFMDLLLHTEKYLSPEYQVRGEIDKKLTALLAGLLKTLLRETVAITSFASRKIQIEMIWQWYQDKQKQILDFSLAKMDERIAAEKAARGESVGATGSNLEQKPNPDATKNSGGPEGSHSARISAERTVKRKFLGYDAEKFGVKPVNQGQVSSVRPLTFTEEAARESESHNITKKMGLYRKRNLSKAEKLRQEIAQRNSAAATSNPSEGGPRVVYTKEAQAKRAPPERPATHHGGRHQGVSGPSPLLHRGPLVENDPETRRLDAAVVASQKHWVKGMIQKVEEANEKREMKDVLTTLAFNQARIEEESSRRLESEQHASQAGRSCHTILRREPRTKDGEEAVTTQSKQPSSSLSREETLKLLGIATFDSSDSTSTSLSPYDDYKPTPMDEAKLQKLLSRVRLPEQQQQQAAMKIKPTHPRNMAGTPAMNVGLDVQTTEETKVSAQVPRTDVPLIEQLFPVLQQEEDVPSLARMEEMRLVERIRECLGRVKTKKGDGFHVPRKEIEMAILTPDDRPREECFKLLPRPSSAFPKNPWLALEGKGKKKGGKGKKKKDK